MKKVACLRIMIGEKREQNSRIRVFLVCRRAAKVLLSHRLHIGLKELRAIFDLLDLRKKTQIIVIISSVLVSSVEVECSQCQRLLTS